MFRSIATLTGSIWAFFAGLGMFGIIVFIALFIFSLACIIKGLILGFAASVVLGLIMFFIPPASFITGLVWFITGTNLPGQLMHWLATH